MAANTLMPPPFFGLQSEDAENWYRDLTNWCAYKKLDDNGKIGLMPLLLKGGARFWFDSLDATTRASFTQISTAFHEAYKRDEAIKWRDTADIWSLNQSPTQSVEDYISKVQQLALRAQMSDEQLRFSILKGLLPSIRQSVLQHDCATVAEIRRWSMIAENATSDIAKDSCVVDAVKRLEEKFNALYTTPVQSNARARSPSPRVHFADTQSKNFGGAVRDHSYDSDSRANNFNVVNRQPWNNWRPQPSTQQERRQDQSQQSSFNQRQRTYGDDGRFYNVYNSQASRGSNIQQPRFNGQARYQQNAPSRWNSNSLG